MKFPSLIFALTAPFLWAEPDLPETAEITTEIEPIPQPEELEDDGSRVSVLGYHEFHSNKPLTQMRIQTSKFRSQMETIKASGIPVISMEKFIQWRKGEAEIPPKSFLITIDDGWKSVYTEAYPILKELQLPFTVFLYKNYVGSSRGGRAMSFAMINEMLESGLCTIGSHSVSHPFPGTVKKNKKAGPEIFGQFLQKELGDSKTFLEENFKNPITTYAYPGGFYTPEMFPLADELGYDNLFTVMPGKVARNSPRHILPRYIVLGNSNGSFNAAVVFRSGASLAGGIPTQTVLPYPVLPQAGHIISSRLPRISAELATVDGLDPDSVVMRVGGFGKVPCELNPETKEVSWTVNRPLRQPVCEVTLQWKLKGKESYEPPINWAFGIDRAANYQVK